MAWTSRDVAAMFQQMVEDRYLALAENVRANRERLGWGQPELARASGVSIGTISRIENGKHEGRNHTIRQLADAFDVRFDELLPAMPQPAEHDSQLDRIEAKLDRLLNVCENAETPPAARSRGRFIKNNQRES